MTVELLASRVATLWDSVARTVDEIATQVDRMLGGSSEPRRADLDLLPTCRQLVEDPSGSIDGAGFVAVPGALADAQYWIEWWQNQGTRQERRAGPLRTETDPTAVAFRDYTTLGWYQAPLHSPGLTVTGPYIDYICTDQHTLTFTRAVGPERARWGMVGVDVLTAWVEQHLADVLDEVPGAVVLNGAGRVVAASRAEHFAGDLLPDADDSRTWARTPCGASQFFVLSPVDKVSEIA